MTDIRRQLQGEGAEFASVGAILYDILMSSVNRPTEYYALFHILTGNFPPGMLILPMHDASIKRSSFIRNASDGDVVRPRDPDFRGFVCPQCDERKPRTPNYWHRDPTSFDGLRTDGCKLCRNAAEREKYEAQRVARRVEAQVNSAYVRASI